MITVRNSGARGHFDHGWLDTRHSFSFADYHDPAQMGFCALRVINEDIVAPGAGFPLHPHREMEIVTYVIAGALEHRDSLGNGDVIRPGELQRMSAGTGIKHSEFNPSESEPVHLLQIWLLPAMPGLEPSWEQKAFPLDARRGRLQPVATPDAREGSLTIHTDVSLYASLLSANETVSHELAAGRHAWLQLVGGSLSLSAASAAAGEEPVQLAPGDGAAVSGAQRLTIAASEPAEFLLFDLA